MKANTQNEQPLFGHLYFAKRETTGEFVAIKHGVTGFYETTIYDQGHCDAMNERQHNTKGQIEAALICSMFGTWEKFEDIAKSFDIKKAKQVPPDQVNEWPSEEQPDPITTACASCGIDTGTTEMLCDDCHDGEMEVQDDINRYSEFGHYS